jgi:hypothetical protein
MGAEDPAGDVKTAQELGCTDLCPMMNAHQGSQAVEWIRTRVRGNSSARSWPGGFVEMHDQAQAAGIDMSLLVWLPPNEAEIRRLAAEIKTFLADNDVSLRSLMLDVEGEWRKGNRGIPHERLAEVAREAFDDWAPPIVVTSFGLLPDEVEPLLRWAIERTPGGAGLPQAYSVVIKNLGTSRMEAPGNLQRIAWERWSAVCGERLIMGLDVYGAEQPGYTVREAMDLQLSATLETGCREIAFWSEESIDGDSADERARREVILLPQYQPSRTWGPARIWNGDLAFSARRYTLARYGSATALISLAAAAAMAAAKPGARRLIRRV